MEKQLYDYVAERVDILSKADSSKQETKDNATAWKEAVAADEAAADAETEKLLDFLEGRMLPIDGLIGFLEGPGAELFGADAASAMLAEQKQRKERGEKYCNCEAHTAAGELLAKFGRIEL
ncbi:MAG: 3-hydroxyisobutyrate dehydrogenase [Eggerthellaceae bacterium]|nr:3-hydroxyisobutyrate dehydrogenase [Eggerthellaceae bacterium]MBQ9068729.1 3-hydroxyisobutyrate dehydrogenase [Eggerthellaceae bacterium]